MTTEVTDVTKVTRSVDRYLAALNEPDATARATLIAAAWSPDGSITDPPLAGQGHGGLVAFAEALHHGYPKHSFARTSEVDSHHDRLRFSWALRGPDGSAAVTGMDVAVIEPDGRVGQVTGFFGELTPIGSKD